MKKSGSFVHGKLITETSGESFPSFFPATGEIIAEIAEADDATIDQAMESASSGFKIWSKMTPMERGRILRKAVQLLREDNPALADLEVLDTGKPIAEAIEVDIHSGADCLEYYASIGETLTGSYIPLGGSFAFTKREPLGICLGIGAWNYPIQIACWKAAPALACGNVMIFKPSEETPMTAVKLAEIFIQAGMPPGVFNVIQGRGDVGRKLSTHPKISKISLTGSVETGKKVMASAAASLKKVTLELGGKSPLIICDDADLKNAISGAMLANFYTQGQICSNGTRVFVQEGVYDKFLKGLLPRVEKMKIGDPREKDTDVGAMMNHTHLEKVKKFIALGEKEGARKLCGGEHPFEKSEGHPLQKGPFLTPVVFADCTDEMTIVKEEIFGPVMAVLKFKDIDEAIKRANNTTFGLAAGVFSKDIQKAHKIIDQLQAGTCWINNYNLTPIEMPFGGYKSSGIGRENGWAAVEYYTQVKSVYVEMGDVESPY
jgi:betaine-aldehyde dehydrogenase